MDKLIITGGAPLNGEIRRIRALLTIALLAIVAVLCRMDSALLLWHVER